MWKKLTVGSGNSPHERRVKLYADENIEPEVVEWLREKKVNVLSARELGHAGKPDSFHAALAFKKKRFLLTKNAKHFLPERELPLHRTYGVIAVEGDMSEMYQWAVVMKHVLRVIIPYGDHYVGTKLLVQPNRITVWFVDRGGNYRCQKFRLERGHAYEWIDPSDPT